MTDSFFIPLFVQTSVPRGWEGGRDGFFFFFLIFEYGGVGGTQHLWLRREGIWANKYQNILLKMFYFTIICVGKKYFLLFEFSSDITTSIYRIYKLSDKHTNTPHFMRSLLCVTVVTHLNDAIE